MRNGRCSNRYGRLRFGVPPVRIGRRAIVARSSRVLLVDSLGLLRQVGVTAADVEDRAGLKQGLTRYRVPAYLGYANCGALAAIEAKYSFQTAS